MNEKKFKKQLLFISIITLTIVIGIIDIVTTTKYYLVTFYLIPIIISSFNFKIYFSIFISLLSAFFVFMTKYYDYKKIEINNIWNVLMFLIGYIVVVYLLNIIKGNIEKEKKLTEEKMIILENSLKDKETIIREIHHRMKNNMSTLISYISLSNTNGETIFIKNLRNKINTFKLLYEKLCYEKDDLSKINLIGYISDLVSLIFNSYNIDKNKISFSITGDQFNIDIKKSTLLGLIVNELSTNSLIHAFNNSNGIIEIHIILKGSNLILIYKDSGPGFVFNNALNQERHIGITLIDMMVKQLSGNISYQSNNGSEFKFFFPNIL